MSSLGLYTLEYEINMPNTHKRRNLSVERFKPTLKKIISHHQNDKTELLAILKDTQEKWRQITPEMISFIADELDISKLQVEGTATFYHFFSDSHHGKYTLYSNTCTTSEMAGIKIIEDFLEKEIGISFGQTTADQKIGLYRTSCIGMCDQEPALLINGRVFPSMSVEKVKNIVKLMKKGLPVRDWKLPADYSEIKSNIRKKGEVFFSNYTPGHALSQAMHYGSLDVIEMIKDSKLRGRGGAGFPTGQKWGFCRATASDERYVICNCDEGEPGTFKDRVLLTERPEMIFEGMALAGYAIESKKGILYLRGEYGYLRPHLEKVLESMRKRGFLGKKILGTRFSFDIRIKEGAGAYICGEESALIESAEGKMGQPRNRPPFPVTSGYLHRPTIVNNPETLCSALQIVCNKADWYTKLGTSESSGTKLLSIAGDCQSPGIYEVQWGITIQEVLNLCGAKNVLAVQVGGPSGLCISERQFNRKLCYSDLSTGGAFTVFGQGRDLLSIVHNHMDFFVHETCGYCVPCRAGNSLLLKSLEKIMVGNGTTTDLQSIRSLGEMVKAASRCGLGQSSPNPLLSTLDYFSEYYKSRVRQDVDFVSGFNLENAIADTCAVAGRKPNLNED